MTIDLRLIADGGLAAETDPSGHIAQTSASTITVTTLGNNETAHESIDYGAAYFGDNFSVHGKLNVSALTGAGTKLAFIGVSDGSAPGSEDAVTNEVGLRFGSTGTTDFSTLAVAREASTNNNGTTSATLAFSTDYYYNLYRLSSLGGQYGANVIQFFSDAGKTTFTAFSIKAATAAFSGRFLYPAQSFNYASAQTVSFTNADMSLSAPAAGIDLTTGVETDTGTSRLDVYPDCIVATALNIANSETAKHVAIDEGAGALADYKVSGVLNVTSFTNGTVGQMFDILDVTNAAADAGVANDLQGITIYWATSTTYKPYIHEAVGGSDSFSTVGPTLNTNQPYSFTLERSGTTLTLKVWNDLVLDANMQGTSQVSSTVTWTGRATTTYRYLMPVASYLNGATSRSSTFTLGGVRALGNPIAATKGAFSWVGKTSTISEQPTSISTTVGAFSWAGKSSPLSLMIQATKGAFNWAGKTVNLNTGGQVNTSPGAFSWAGKSSPLSLLIAASKGAFSWAGKTTLVGSTVTSLRTATLTKWDTATSKEIPDTGLTTVLYMLYDPINLKVFDFSDNTFKASASCVTPQGTMTERSLLNSVGTNLTPGVYDILLSTTGLSGLYQEYLFYYGATNHFDSNPVRFQDGIEYLGGLTVAENTTLNAVPTAAVNADAVWDEVLTKNTHNIANSAGKIVRQLRGMTIHEGTAQAGGINTITLDTGASAINHIYKECLIVIIDGTAAGEAHHILSYNGTTKLATVDQNWYVQPDNTSDFIMFGSSAHDTVETGLAQAATTTSITLNGTASTTDDLYNDQMIFISSGTGTGQVRRIADYVGATKVATVDKAWTITPDSTSGYMLYPAVVFAADVKKMNAATVTGNGTSGDLWRGA